MPFDPAQVDLKVWREAQVLKVQPWPDADGLASLILSGEAPGQLAGQYIQLASSDPEGLWGVRYLSLASAPGQPLELLVAPASQVDEPGDPAALQVGDSVYVSRLCAGRLTTPALSAEGRLWLLAAGTGLAPLLSVRRSIAHDRVVLVHSVSKPSQLAYREELERSPGVYIPWVTGQGRPRLNLALAEGGALEAHVGYPLRAQNDRVMLCGSAEYLTDMRALLEARGLPREHVITEW